MLCIPENSPSPRLQKWVLWLAWFTFVEVVALLVLWFAFAGQSSGWEGVAMVFLSFLVLGAGALSIASAILELSGSTVCCGTPSCSGVCLAVGASLRIIVFIVVAVVTSAIITVSQHHGEIEQNPNDWIGWLVFVGMVLILLQNIFSIIIDFMLMGIMCRTPPPQMAAQQQGVPMQPTNGRLPPAAYTTPQTATPVVGTLVGGGAAPPVAVPVVPAKA